MSHHHHCQRAGRRAIGDRMKLHLRVRRFAGCELRLLMLRPGTQVSYATNHFHDTWHLLGDGRFARLLAHLFWALSFQRLPGTAVLLADPHRVPNPFDAEPSDPILLLPGELTHPTADAIRQLSRRLCHLGPSDRTVRLHSHGLRVDAPVSREHKWRAEKLERIAGVLVYRAPRAMLRDHAVRFLSGVDCCDRGWSYWELGQSWPPMGEVQLFSNFRQRVSAARVARGRLVAEGCDVKERPQEVWVRTNHILANRGR